jgi:hypothetical protein
MSDTGDPQDLAEALDADRFDQSRIDSDGPALEPDYPADRPLGVADDTVTPRMEQVRESLEDRVEREEPDPLAEVLDETVDLTESGGVQPGAEEGAVDAGPAPSLDAEEVGDPVGRLVEPGADDVLDAELDDEATAVAADTGGDPASADLTAEEAALHLTPAPPPGRPDGGYLSEP